VKLFFIGVIQIKRQIKSEVSQFKKSKIYNFTMNAIPKKVVIDGGSFKHKWLGSNQ